MRLTSTVKTRLANHKPKLEAVQGDVLAAVAVVFREHQGKCQFLMMQRSQDPRDPWSGQMAFPGGKIDPTDKGAKEAAIREANEEVGVDLTQHAYIGQLNDFLRIAPVSGKTVRVSPFVFELSSEVQLTGNYEVADLVWVEASVLSDPSLYQAIEKPHLIDKPMPGIVINPDKNQILWGLSLVVLMDLYDTVAWQVNEKYRFSGFAQAQ